MILEQQQICSVMSHLLSDSELVHWDIDLAQHHAKIISSLLVCKIYAINKKEINLNVTKRCISKDDILAIAGQRHLKPESCDTGKIKKKSFTLGYSCNPHSHAGQQLQLMHCNALKPREHQV